MTVIRTAAAYADDWIAAVGWYRQLWDAASGGVPVTTWEDLADAERMAFQRAMGKDRRHVADVIRMIASARRPATDGAEFGAVAEFPR